MMKKKYFPNVFHLFLIVKNVSAKMYKIFHFEFLYNNNFLKKCRKFTNSLRIFEHENEKFICQYYMYIGTHFSKLSSSFQYVKNFKNTS